MFLNFLRLNLDGRTANHPPLFRPFRPFARPSDGGRLHRRHVAVDAGHAAAVVRVEVDVHHLVDFLPVVVSGERYFCKN